MIGYALMPDAIKVGARKHGQTAGLLSTSIGGADTRLGLALMRLLIQ